MDKAVLLVIDKISNPHAGTEGQFLLLINQLLASGYVVRVMVLAGSDWLQKNGLPCDYDVLGRAAIKSPLTWWAAYQYARRYRQSGFNVAHVFFNDASVICPPVFALAGIKTIISRRDMGFWYNRIYRLVLPFTGRFVSYAVSNSYAVSEVTGTVERIPSQRLKVIYNGYAIKPIAGIEVSELEALKAQGANLFGLVANIRPIKRMQDAIAALASLDMKIGNPHVVIVGAGDASELQALARRLGVEERVHFLGGRSDVNECLRYFSAGLLCSESEGFSNAIVEYQFAGLPVICTRTGGNPEAVDNTTGWLYEVGDVAGLAQAMRALLENPGTAAEKGKNAKAMAGERYSVGAMRDAYIELYESLRV